MLHTVAMFFKYTPFVFSILFFGNSLAVPFTVELKSHSDTKYNVTTIFELNENHNNSSTSCSTPNKSVNVSKSNDCYDVTIHLGTNAIGMPVHFNRRVLSLNGNALEFIVDGYYPNKYITNNHVEYDRGRWKIRPWISTWKPATGGLLIINTHYYREIPFTIDWTQNNTKKGCISLTYVTLNSPTVCLNIYEKENSSSMLSYAVNSTNGLTLKTLVLRIDELFLSKTNYRLVITVTRDSFVRLFAIKRIAQCNYEDGEVYKMSGNEIEDFSLSANVYQLNECLWGTQYGRDCHRKCEQNCSSCDMCDGICYGTYAGKR